MAKYVDIDDMIARVENFFRKKGNPNIYFSRKQLIYLLETAKEKVSIDIVQCKDCKHCFPQEDYIFCDIHAGCPSGDYFCASGEKK